MFHEGNSVSLHVAQVTDQVLLLITFGRQVPVGKVRLYTQRAVGVLARILRQDDPADVELRMDDEFEVAIDCRIDEVLRDNTTTG